MIIEADPPEASTEATASLTRGSVIRPLSPANCLEMRTHSATRHPLPAGQPGQLPQGGVRGLVSTEARRSGSDSTSRVLIGPKYRKWIGSPSATARRCATSGAPGLSLTRHPPWYWAQTVPEAGQVLHLGHVGLQCQLLRGHAETEEAVDGVRRGQ